MKINWNKISLWTMAIFYLLAGLNHFRVPQFYIDIMPAFFPEKELLNLISGGVEIITAIGLLILSTRKMSSIVIVLMLISFFAVHISHIFQAPEIFKELGKFPLYIRLVLQFVLIYWAFKVGNIRDKAI